MELAISYKRFSSLAQAKGRSEGRQDYETEAYCARKEYKIIETFGDRGFSAYTGENSDKGDLKAILDMTAAGKIRPGTHLVVEIAGPDQPTRNDSRADPIPQHHQSRTSDRHDI